MSNRQRGFTLVEAVVTIAVFSVGLIAVASLASVAKSTSDQSRDIVQVNNYLQEGLEAVRSLRTAGWNNVASDGAYRLQAVGASPPWQLAAGGSETVGKYQRTVNIDPVSREDSDGNGALSAGDKIVPSGGTLPDASTKKVTITLTWQQGNKTRTRSLNYYLTDWQS